MKQCDISKEDVLEVAKRTNTKLTEGEAAEVLELYPGEQEQDKAATWDLAVDNIIQGIKSRVAKKNVKAELNRLFKKGGLVIAGIGNKPFYVCDVNRECHISLSRMNEVKQALLEASLIENIKSAGRREHCFKLTEKGRQIQENLIAVVELVSGD